MLRSLALAFLLPASAASAGKVVRFPAARANAPSPVGAAPRLAAPVRALEEAAVASLLSASPAAAADPRLLTRAALQAAEERSAKLDAADGAVVFESGRAELSDAFMPELQRLAKARETEAFKALYERQAELVGKLAALSLGARGELVIARPHGADGYRLETRPAGAGSGRVVDIPASRWLRHLGDVSPSGRRALLGSEGFTKLRVLSLETGEIAFEAESRPGEEFHGIHATFSPGDDVLTLNRAGSVDVVALEDAGARTVGRYELGDRTMDLGQGNFMIPIVRDGLGQVSYLPSQNAFVTFYYGPEPMVLKLGQQGWFKPKAFARADIHFSPSSAEEGVAPDVAAVMSELEKPSYSPSGLVSPGERLLFANRTQGRGESFLSFIDIFSLETQKLLRSIPVPDTMSKLAFSAAQRLLAVSTANNGGVRVYDLDDPGPTPAVKIAFQNREGGLLSFAPDGALLAGSINFSSLSRFEPLRKIAR